MTSFEEFKANMGDEYMKKVKEIAESKNINDVTKVCSACHQLEFDHKPETCTRASKGVKSAKDISDITEKMLLMLLLRIQSWNLRTNIICFYLRISHCQLDLGIRLLSK